MTKETIRSPQVEYKSSEILESWRLVDYYPYLIRNGKIYSPVTEKPVEESITRRNLIEIIEADAFDKIQNWAVYSLEGSCVWVSPPARSDLSAKAVISEIEHDPVEGKKLSNRNICFDWDEDLFLHFAEYCRRDDIQTGEDLRGKPIFLLPRDKYKLFELLRGLEPRQIKQVETGEDIKIKEELKAHIAQGGTVSTGSYAPSCPTSAFEVFSGLVDKYGSREFRCPHCDKINTRPPGQLISNCQHCGGDVRC
jgi:hypothetical protein